MHEHVLPLHTTKDRKVKPKVVGGPDKEGTSSKNEPFGFCGKSPASSMSLLAFVVKSPASSPTLFVSLVYYS
jgi:hypothetical protein